MATLITAMVIFGNPKGGTPLMQSAPSIGLGLPLKAWRGRMRPAASGLSTTSPNGWPSVTGSPGGWSWYRG